MAIVGYLPVVALLTRKTLQVVDITFGAHYHFEGGNDFVAGCTVACCSKESGEDTSVS